MAGFNYQPLFTSQPVMVAKTILPDVVDGPDPYYWATGQSLVYTVAADNGELIERITISACGDPDVNTNVHAKLVSVWFFWSTAGSKYSLYKTFTMPDVTVSHTTPNPRYELTFTGGIVLRQSDAIIIGSSIDATGFPSDYLAVTIEGGTYTNLY